MALQTAIQEDYAYLESLYLHLHKNPELSFHEAKTSDRMATELRELGFTVTEKCRWLWCCRRIAEW